jgi:choline monooxygenase
MDLPRIEIDPDIRRARTLPAEVYRDGAWFERLTERVLARSWHLVADASEVAEPGTVLPFELLPAAREEPLLLACDAAGEVRCLSNVCTHRGNVVVEEAGKAAALRCRYHGRRFGLDGKFVSMPRFEGVRDFPAPADDLPRVPLGRFSRFLFASLSPMVPFAVCIDPVVRLLSAVDVSGWSAHPETSEYEVGAHWALYVDNYLEGFHIPFVHAGLAAVVDPSGYRVETLPWGVVQTATARRDEPALPGGGSERVAALYVWMFPTTMLNLYPWGLSVNLVRPVAPDRTRVAFLSYVRDPSLRETGAGADLHRVEMEDEAVVSGVQRGVRSRLYDRGRYSPTEEVGVHHFHRLLARCVNDGA